MKSKKVYILIGPKGSGKSFIGQLMHRHYQIPFLRVEDIALQVKKARSITDQAYITDVFGAIETEVRRQLAVQSSLIFESTGLTDAFDHMRASLEQDFTVFLLKVTATPEKCLHRVKTRDTSMHVNVSDTEVDRINAAVGQKYFVFDGVIENTQASIENLLAQIDTILRQADIEL